MAMKSDFAQKLLNDLRLKKERMAASHSTGNSNAMTRDGQRNSSQTYRGSQKIKGAESGRPNTANSQRRTSGSARLLTDKENSSQLVQYRSGQSSGQRVDLPMAFLLALQSSGKQGRSEFSGSNPMLQFLQQIGKKSLDTGKMARNSSPYQHHSSTNHFPAFSNLHVNEISKGVQHLNHILKACSNGLNIDKYSIEVGKELLKGATDLEESLRMLVNLQEASEYMIKPQRKNRITLLEEEEDDEANNGSMVEQKQLDLPRFSFDKRSRNSHSYVTKTDPNQSLIELTYHAKSSSFSSNQTLNSNSEPHRRSSSWSPNFKTPTDPESKSHSNSSRVVPEKGRMSSVIAKLMGLEEIPEKVHSQIRQRESGMRNGEGTGIKITYMTTKNAEVKTKTERQETRSKKHNVMKQDHKVSEIKNGYVSQKAEKHHVSLQLESVVVIADENSQRKYQERVKKTTGGSGLENIATKIDEQQSSINRSVKILEYQKNMLDMEAGRGLGKHKQLKTTEKTETKEPFKDEMQQKVKHNRKRSEDANMLQEKSEQKEVTAQTDKRNSESLAPKNQLKFQQDNGLHVLRKPDIQEEKHQTKKREEQNIISNLLSTTKNESPVRSKVPSKTLHNAKRSKKKHPPMNQAAATRKIYRETCDEMPQKEQPNSRHGEKSVKDESASDVLINIDQNASTKELASHMPIEKHLMLTLNQKKPVHVLATGKKVEFTQKLRGQTPRKINEKMNKKNDSLTNLVTPPKHQNEVTQESRQSMQDTATVIEGTEPLSSATCQDGEGSLKKAKSEEIVQTLNTDEHNHVAAAMTIITIGSKDDECRNLEVALPQDANDSIKDISNKVQSSLSEQKSLETLPDSFNGSNEKCLPKLQEHKKAVISWKQELLTENEKKLKETLIKSPLFLNTAEALFKLNIPVGILHASDQIYQEKATKFTIDCAYEVMNRKGRRQELLQPCVKISICYTMVSSLDNLIKQLYKDFEKLKYYGGNEHDDYDDAETLLKMLERDIQNTDPHLNCMWDFGWNNVMFAFDETNDVIKDVERQVLEELIDEITRDI